MFSSILLLLSSVIPIAYSSSECDQQLKSIFTDLANVSSDNATSVPIPAACDDMRRNVLSGEDGFLGYRTNYNTFCASSSTLFNASVVTYSYDLTIAVANTTYTGAEMAEFAYTILANSTDAHNCNSGLTYIANGESGWTLWVEEFNTASSQCLAPTADEFIGLLAFQNLAEEKKTSFCVTMEGDNNWRGVIRGLYSSETRFESVADVPCYSSNPGFPVVTNCFD